MEERWEEQADMSPGKDGYCHCYCYCASYFVSFMNKCVNLSCHQILEYLLYCIVQFVHVTSIEFQLRSFQKLYSRFYPHGGEEYKEEVGDGLLSKLIYLII